MPNKKPVRQSSNVNRAITQRLRQLDLSGEHGWKLHKRPGANDVPPYNSWTTFIRKVRIALTAPEGSGQEINSASIYAAAGLTYTCFPKLTITHMAVYGQTNQGIVVHTRIIENYDQVTLNKVLSDYGVPGQRRACVRASISERDQRWYTGNGTGILLAVDAIDDQGLTTSGQIIVDLTVKFSGTTSVLRLASSEKGTSASANESQT